MAAKVDSSSPAEPPRAQSTVSASSPKVSKFGAKSGFVIPKNKLSGSLVPVFRSGSKVDVGTGVKEESAKQVQRKTKWGADLTQDGFVRKGRVLAYQTRVEQITEQLKSGALEIDDGQGSQSPEQDSSQKSATEFTEQKARKFELLELEKREIIGEILRLNPSYKAPPDYKPLLKEAKVPIPVKAYPGYNFIGLLLGPENNTQKRLQEETGAKLRVYGTKVGSKEKRELNQSDVSEAQGAYDELYVNVSADTYEKVDAAVSLIELLVTTVSGSATVASKNSTSVIGNVADVYQQTQKDLSGNVVSLASDVNQGVPQSVLVPTQSGQLPLQPQYSAPWYPVAPNNAPARPNTGFFPVPPPNNPVQFPSSGCFPPYFQPTPFSSAPRTALPPLSRPQLPLQVMQQQSPNQGTAPQNQVMQGQLAPLAYPNVSNQSSSNPPASFSASRPVLIGLMPPSRPSIPINQQPGSNFRPLVTNQAPPGAWSTASPVGTSPRTPNMTHMAPQPFNPPLRPQQPSLLQPNMPMNRAPSVNFAPFPSQPATAAPFAPLQSQIGLPSMSQPPMPSALPSSAPRPLPVASVTSAPVAQASSFQPATPIRASGPSASQAMVPSQSVVPIMIHPPVPLPSAASGVMPSPHPSPATAGSAPSSMPSFSPASHPANSSTGAPLVPAPKPLRPSSADFTFQPLRSQVADSPTTPRPSTSSIAQNISPIPSADPQAPSFWPAPQNSRPLMESGLLSSATNQRPPVLPSPTPASFLANSSKGAILQTPFPTSSTAVQPPPRFLFPNSNAASPTAPSPQVGRPMIPSHQLGLPSFSPAPRMSMPGNSVPPRPPNFFEPGQNQPHLANRPGGLMIPNQQPASNQHGSLPSRPSVGNQFYDPFSPSSVSSAPPLQGGEQLNVRKQETDAEYEDLMASVGVK